MNDFSNQSHLNYHANKKTHLNKKKKLHDLDA